MRKLISTCLAGLLVAVAVVATAQEGAADMAAKAAEGQMSAEQEAMMKKMMELASPGEGHKRLAKYVGTWKATIKMMEPGTEPTESMGTSTAESVLGGRYLVTKYTGTYMDQPFEGMSVAGFDNLHQKSNNLWVDNMGTGFYTTSGTCDEAGVCTFTGEWDNPMDMTKIPVREVVTWKDDNSYMYEMYQKRGEQEMRVMEISYTRQ